MAEVHYTTEWRSIPGYPGYRIQSDGVVESCWKRIGLPGLKRRFQFVQSARWKQLKTHKNPSGYVQIRIGGQQCYVHQLVLESFVGLRPEGMECSHLNGDPEDNSISNLVYETHRNNEARKVEHGTKLAGSKHPRWGKPSTFRGKHHTDKAKQAMRQKALGRIISDATRKKFCVIQQKRSLRAKGYRQCRSGKWEVFAFRMYSGTFATENEAIACVAALKRKFLEE